MNIIAWTTQTNTNNGIFTKWNMHNSYSLFALYLLKNAAAAPHAYNVTNEKTKSTIIA